MRVQEQPREAGGEVLDEAVGHVAQRLPQLGRQLPVVVPLQGSERRAGGAQRRPGPSRAPTTPALERTLFLTARSRSRTDVP